jgi:uncharacterized membrane protein YgdD (TMEM256/DUF423 family)
MNALAVGAILALLAVLLGAFGAHWLRPRLGERTDVYETGARYHLVHALAFIALGVWQATGTAPALLTSALWLLLVGIVLFSGSLYVLSLWRVRLLGPVTPLGGLVLCAGWLVVFLAALAR